ncbi:hypothetical protein ACRRTK_019921 [Alexandromys fortis]
MDSFSFLIIHSRNKPYSEKCEKALCKKSYLTQHKLSHTWEKTTSARNVEKTLELKHTFSTPGFSY